MFMVNDVVLVFLLLTLNIFHTCVYCYCEQVNASRVESNIVVELGYTEWNSQSFRYVRSEREK